MIIKISVSIYGSCIKFEITIIANKIATNPIINLYMAKLNGNILFENELINLEIPMNIIAVANKTSNRMADKKKNIKNNAANDVIASPKARFNISNCFSFIFFTIFITNYNYLQSNDSFSTYY